MIWVDIDFCIAKSVNYQELIARVKDIISLFREFIEERRCWNCKHREEDCEKAR